MKPIHCALSFVTAALLCFSLRGGAEPVTYHFTGTVSAVDPRLSGTFDLSQGLSGSFTYESTTAGEIFGTEQEGLSYYSMALMNFTLSVGSYVAQPPFGNAVFSGIQVVNQPLNDRFVLDSQLSGTPINGYLPLARITFLDESGMAFSDTHLANGLNLGNWLSQPGHSAAWYLAFSSNEGEPNVSGSLSSIALVSVPEPSTVALLGCGVGLMAGSIYRRRFRS